MEKRKPDLFYIWIVVVQLIVIFFLSKNETWFEELGTILGFIFTPISGLIIASLVGAGANSTGTLKDAHLKKFLITNVVLALLFFSVGQNAFRNHFQIRHEISWAEKYQQSMDQELSGKIGQKLPHDYIISEVRYDGTNELYWFSAIEPASFAKPKHYIGFYKSSDVHQVLSVSTLWEQVKDLKGIPLNTILLENNLRLKDLTVYFKSAYRINYSAKLTVENGNIVLKDIN